MNQFEYRGNTYSIREGESLLEAGLRQGLTLKYSCRKGTCKTCKAKLVKGELPKGSQGDLDDNFIRQNIFLPCLTYPKSHLSFDDFIFKNANPKKNRFKYREELESEIVEPDPELWEALEHGELLIKILTDFYTKVYKDDRLAPYFKSVTIDRAIGKQYNFLEEILTGKKVYFGAFPRSAHHWMIIDDELFDYRERLIEDSMRKFELEESMIQRWLKIQEHFREMIVKDEPWQNIIDGTLIPLKGLAYEKAEIAMVCDGCGEVINEGDSIMINQDEGTIYCKDCYQH